ncbi:uncharacterized protein PFL1_00104 [Pseudozyma flocculosa PF-1]|uniref:Related to 4-coumarate-CoA ligase n=1 Tax=Pseudozyma flocculosa TaxID=84751 RepID=A0A5C3ES92_9BASI|nr:uncharacterized protein PFL1_00104 [Pseudozyma flocculosa PF-1]EPQ31905.1 hypothetical protein PFL1_00104 [Pseudozyma flocculosa PF-1]SPO35183.1 related to 4-coumarate-CoA ligase [Pseudozyma flocculosa]
MLFRSPYPLDPPRDESLHHFLFRPVADAGSCDPSSSNRVDEPLLYPTPADNTSRPGAKPISLRQVRELSYDFAAGLQATASARGAKRWGRGDVLAVYASNQHDYLAGVLGALVTGASVALCNPSYKPDELSHQLRMVGARAILTTAASYDNACTAAEGATRDGKEDLQGLAQPPEIFVFEESHDSSWAKVIEAGKQQGGSARKELEQVRVSPSDDTAILCFSSGTSGKPKAVRLSHASLVANIIQATFLLLDRVNPPLFGQSVWYDDKPMSDGILTVQSVGRKISAAADAISDLLPGRKAKDSDGVGARPASGEFHLDLLPLFHCYGLLMGFVALHTATPRVVLPRFQLDVFLSAVQQHKVTFCFVVPPILLALAKSSEVDKYDVSSLKRVASGAASLSAELEAAVQKRLGIRSTDGYGMSEMSPIISMQNLKDLEIAPRTVGVLAPGTEAKVVDINGNELGPDEEGELWLRGPQMMQGYLRNDEANRSAFVPSIDDPERFLRTGDVVRIDKRGYIRITDRLKDVIKYHGFQVSPSELEDLLFHEERVADCAVTGIADPKDSSELPWAFVVLTDHDRLHGEQADEAERDEARRALMDSVNAKVSANYKKLRGVTLLDKLPKSDSGKILKRELKAFAVGPAKQQQQR